MILLKLFSFLLLSLSLYAADTRPIFDIALDIDNTVVFKIDDNTVIPEGYQSFKVGHGRYVVAPYFVDFIKSLLADPKTQFRFSFSTTKETDEAHEFLKSIEIRPGLSAYDLSKARIVTLNKKTNQPQKDINIINSLYNPKPELKIERTLIFDDEQGWRQMFTNLIRVNKARPDLILNGQVEVEKLKQAAKHTEAEALQKIIDKDNNLWLSARGLIDQLIQGGETPEKFLTSLDNGSDLTFNLLKQSEAEDWAKKGEAKILGTHPDFSKLPSSLCAGTLKKMNQPD